MINVFYDEKLNIDLGLLNYLHPFDGMKFYKIYQDILDNKNLTFHSTSKGAVCMSFGKIQ
jgi:histone deacetylase 11